LKKSGRVVAIPWAPGGPVLSPLNFILWGAVKIRNVIHLKEKKIEKAAEIGYSVYGKEWNTDWKCKGAKVHT